jgi:hypothetical protein
LGKGISHKGGGEVTLIHECTMCAHGGPLDTACPFMDIADSDSVIHVASIKEGTVTVKIEFDIKIICYAGVQ